MDDPQQGETPVSVQEGPTAEATEVGTSNDDEERQVVADRNRAIVNRYVDEEQNAAELVEVMIVCAANADIAITDRIKEGGQAIDQMLELLETGVLDNYDVLECTASKIDE